MRDRKIGNPRERAFHDAINDPMIPATLEVAAPPRWEYRSVLLPREADINPYGAEGWELVSVTAQPGDQAVYYFRRPKEEKPAGIPAEPADAGPRTPKG